LREHISAHEKLKLRALVHRRFGFGGIALNSDFFFFITKPMRLSDERALQRGQSLVEQPLLKLAHF